MEVYVVQDRDTGLTLGVFTTLEKIAEKFFLGKLPRIIITQREVMREKPETI